MSWFRKLFRREPKPCDCDGCTGREPNRSRSPYVSHGLHMTAGRDGKIHWRAKSRIVSFP